ncbi:hypothetical protein [Terrimonas pollutisoli]|uniref:hypothetical protein n=1 Tax=Terrimonas pollutisoli TaxID=3034147 RepID=UPI0023ED9EE4|nr:hypothetical protein [Terrimonas sp. H1YJ31]
MKQYEKYLIGNLDIFESGNYPAVNTEIINVNQKTAGSPLFYKEEIIISFLKNHSLRNDWIDANPQLTKLVTSGQIFTGNIESLFEACRDNKTFSDELENHLTERFATTGKGAKLWVM